MKFIVVLTSLFTAAQAVSIIAPLKYAKLPAGKPAEIDIASSMSTVSYI